MNNIKLKKTEKVFIQLKLGIIFLSAILISEVLIRVPNTELNNNLNSDKSISNKSYLL